MNVKTLRDIPPWEWPRDAGKTIQKMLMNRQANESDRVLAAEFAGEIVVIDDELADSLVTIVGSPDESEQLRSTAAIALGPVLEQTDTDGFDDPDEPPITEGSFRNIQESLQKLYFDDTVPKQVRRRILEASVRAPEKWHENAIRAAYASGDRDWVLTAVFSMRWVRGFDDQILEALKSTDPEIHYEAIEAAGNSELEGAWSHVVNLVQDHRTPKRLLLAAIMAVGSIHPEEAGPILVHLADSDDEEIAEAAHEAMAMAEIPFDEEDEEGEGERMN